MSSNIYSISRILFLRIIGIIYLAAFFSLLYQYNGLYSCEGLEPLQAYANRIKTHYNLKYDNQNALFDIIPTLLFYYPNLHISIDSLAIIILTLGVLLSFIISIGITYNIVAYILLYYFYYSFVAIGQSFLSFQWDILLLESGFLAIFFSDVIPQILTNKFQLLSQHQLKLLGINKKELDYTACIRWIIKYLLFKLMFSSGVVKLQSNDVNWTELNALLTHYATQPLPVKFAWFAHNAGIFINKLSVAGCLYIEIIGALLVLIPRPGFIRNFSCLLQIILQLLIISTGNYTFFNYLTMLLCIVLLDNNVFKLKFSNKYKNQLRTMRLFEIGWKSCFVIINIWVFIYLFNIHPVSINISKLNYNNKFNWYYNVLIYIINITRNYDITPNYTETQFNEFVNFVVNHTWKYMLIILIIVYLSQLYQLIKQAILIVNYFHENTIHQKNNQSNPKSDINPSAKSKNYDIIKVYLITFVKFGYITILFIASLLLFASYSNNLTSLTINNNHPHYFKQASEYLSSYHVSNNYGLFRSLTGVGKNIKFRNKNIPTVARPEIIIEINYTNNTSNNQFWHEIGFQYKPQAVNKSPELSAPHQPRIDWQIWFAALTPNAPGWFLHLCYKLLHNKQSEAVKGLLDMTDIIKLNKTESPLYVRAKLYHYDFTHIYSINSNNNTLTTVDTLPTNYWQRKYIRQYLPPTDINNVNILQYLKQYNWIKPNACKQMQNEIKQLNKINPPFIVSALVLFAQALNSNQPLFFSFIIYFTITIILIQLLQLYLGFSVFNLVIRYARTYFSILIDILKNKYGIKKQPNKFKAE